MSVGAAAALLCGMGALLLSGVAAAQAPAPVDPPADPAEPPAGEAPAAPAEPAPAEPAPVEPAPVEPSPAEPAPAELPPAAEATPAPSEELPLTEEPVAEDIGDVDTGAEVVVTVDRRTKNLQDYSGTAAAFSETALTGLGITTVRDLAVTVPGLQISTVDSGTSIFIRGIGSDNNTELGDPAVALHVDGVYMPRPRGLGQMFFDIARVEVNSGPQGTLRGRNAVGGSVNIVTNQPKLGEFEANAQATFGSYSQRSYQGMVNIPVGDTLALRVAAMSMVHDPYWENAGPLYDIEGAQNADDWAVRSTLKWQPIERLQVTVAYDYMTERGTGYVGAQFINELNRVDDDGNPLFTDPNDYDSFGNPRRVYMRGWNQDVNMWHQGVRGNVTYDAGPVIFEAMGSYRSQDYKQLNTYAPGVILPTTDITIYNPDEYDGQEWHNTSKATILELRAFAPDTARLRWSLGGFFFNEDQGAFLGQVRDPAGGYGGGEFNMPSTIGRSVAGYADATFDVTDELRALAGIRVTHEYKERTGGIWATWTGTGFNPAPRFATEGFAYAGFDRSDYGIPGNNAEERVNWFFDGIKSFGARDEMAIRLCNDPPAAPEGGEQEPRLVLNEEGRFRCSAGVRENLPDNIFNIVRQDYSVTSNYVDWRAGLEYDLADENLIYATVTTGHKAAGFNDTLASGDETFNSDYDNEKVVSFELGSKNRFLDRKLKLNAAAFFFTYSGMQFQTIIGIGEPPPRDPVTGEIEIDPNTGMQYEDLRPSSAVRQNAQETTNVYGLDMDIIYSLPAGLEAELHALVMDARFSDGTYVTDTRLDPGNINAQVNLGGNWLPRTSPFTLNYNLSQLIFTDAGSFDWVIQGQTRGQHYFTVYNGNGKRLVEKGPEWDPRIEASTNYQATLANPNRLNDEVPTYTTVNIGAGWKHPDGRLSIRGFVNNLLDVTYSTFIASTGGNNLRFYNNQRLAGVTVRVDW